ncbi:unnamed protein product [Ranitomeya imitator]|uniref:Uncharacterized protein n=1 Tax=Ranitomeya imitator TaxID=111125 RepID=A0ABN9KZY3_9NEOB|nr:unnamed protein product [Ranitomeya imitator]
MSWNSTLQMLERIWEQERAAVDYQHEQGHLYSVQTSHIRPQEWTWMLDICTILYYFEDSTKMVSSDDAIISVTIPLLCVLKFCLLTIKEDALQAEHDEMEQGTIQGDYTQPSLISSQCGLFDNEEEEEEQQELLSCAIEGTTSTTVMPSVQRGWPEDREEEECMVLQSQHCNFTLPLFSLNTSILHCKFFSLNTSILHCRFFSLNTAILHCSLNTAILHCSFFSLNIAILYCRFFSLNTAILHCRFFSLNTAILHCRFFSLNTAILHCRFFSLNTAILHCRFFSLNTAILHCRFFSLNIAILHCRFFSLNTAILQCQFFSLNTSVLHCRFFSLNAAILHCRFFSLNIAILHCRLFSLNTAILHCRFFSINTAILHCRPLLMHPMILFALAAAAWHWLLQVLEYSPVTMDMKSHFRAVCVVTSRSSAKQEDDDKHEHPAVSERCTLYNVSDGESNPSKFQAGPKALRGMQPGRTSTNRHLRREEEGADMI